MPGFLIKNFGASKVLRWQRHLASQLAPLLQNQKNALSDVLFNSGASKGARTLDLNLGKVAL